MRLVIDGPESGGEGVYYLLTEEGELLFHHFCSNASFAEGDLIRCRPERQANLNTRWPDGWQIVTLAELGITSEELNARNVQWIERLRSDRNA